MAQGGTDAFASGHDGHRVLLPCLALVAPSTAAAGPQPRSCEFLSQDVRNPRHDACQDSQTEQACLAPPQTRTVRSASAAAAATIPKSFWMQTKRNPCARRALAAAAPG